jgi:hypothetical protein
MGQATRNQVWNVEHVSHLIVADRLPPCRCWLSQQNKGPPAAKNVLMNEFDHNQKRSKSKPITCKSSSPHAAGDGRSVVDASALFQRFVEGDGVEEDGFVESGHEWIDGIFGERVIKFLAGDPFDFIRETGVLFRVRDAGRHRQ